MYTHLLNLSATPLVFDNKNVYWLERLAAIKLLIICFFLGTHLNSNTFSNHNLFDEKLKRDERARTTTTAGLLKMTIVLHYRYVYIEKMLTAEFIHLTENSTNRYIDC